MTTRAPRRRVGHRHGNQPYYFENSLRGLLWFLKLLFPWVDFDCHVTRDGILVITHWPKPLRHGFYDPHDGHCDVPGCVVQPNQTIEELTWAQVSRLRSTDGKGFRISRADVLVPKALRRGIKVELEMKTPTITADQLSALWHVIRADGLHPDDVQAKAYPEFLPALEAASETGRTTIVLTHPGHRRVPVGPDRWRPDYYRGMRPIWTGAGR